jgi:hypothetical protein
MAVRSRDIVLRELGRRDAVSRALDAIRHGCYLEAQLEDLNLLLGRERSFELDQAVRRLEERIEWMRSLLGGSELALELAELEGLERENAQLLEQVRRLLDQLLASRQR